MGKKHDSQYANFGWLLISMLNRGNKIQIQRNIIQFYSFPFFSLNPFVNILRKLPEHIFLF